MRLCLPVPGRVSTRRPFAPWSLMLLATALWIGLYASSALAVEPSASYIFPAGGQRGREVQVRVGGHFLLGEARFTMAGPGVTASPTVKEVETLWFEGPVIPMPASQRPEDYPRDHAGTVNIAADAPLGFRRWRVQTSQGITRSMLFVVGDLPEIMEEEIDGAPIPVEVQTPVTINGRIFPREDVDIWTFAAKAGETYYAEVHSARLGYPLEARLALYGPDGHLLADDSGTFGADPFLSFTAPSDGQYRLHIHDSHFEGLQDYVYRLTIHRAPYVQHHYPLGGRRGSQQSLSLAGPGLVDATATMSLPNEGDEAWVQPAWQGRTLNPILLELGDDPEVLETEPNQAPSQALEVPVPGVANGRIETAGDTDVWALKASAGQAYRIELRAAQLGSPLDAVLTVQDAAGKMLATVDDANGSADPAVSFTAAAADTYFVKVAERFTSRGGPHFAYRLKITAADSQPGFNLRLPMDVINVEPGGQTQIRFEITRHGGFDGAVNFEAQGLPEGIEVTGNVGAKRTLGQLVFKCAGDVDWPQRLDLKIIGQGEHVTGSGKDQVRQPVTALAMPNVPRGTPSIDGLTLFVGAPTPFKFVSEYSLTYAPQGSILTKHYTLERGGYEGPLTVRLADRQTRHLQGVTGPSLRVPPDANSFEYPVTLPSWLEIGRTSRTVLMAIGEITDRHGKRHRVSYTSAAQNEQIILIADPAQLTLTALPTSIMADPRQPSEIHVRIARGSAVQGPITLALRTPDHVHGVSAEPVTLPVDAESGTLRVQFSSDAGPFNAPLLIQASAGQGGKQFKAETAVEVVTAPSAK